MRDVTAGYLVGVCCGMEQTSPVETNAFSMALGSDIQIISIAGGLWKLVMARRNSSNNRHKNWIDMVLM